VRVLQGTRWRSDGKRRSYQRTTGLPALASSRRPG